MANNLQKAAIYREELDKKFMQQAVTSFMEPAAAMIEYHGGDTVFMPDIDMDGLANYDRAKGFVGGGVTLKWRPYVLTQDRGRQFSVDSMDLDETKFLASMANVMGEFQRKYVVPEVDSYRLSKIHALASAESQTRALNLTQANILDAVEDDIAKIVDLTGEGRENLVVLMNALVHSTFINNDKISKMIVPSEFERGELKTIVKSYNDTPLLSVSTSRMKTLYEIYDGVTAGQEKGGMVPAAGAKQINYIIVHRNAVIAPSKTDKIRFFDPSVNQKADAWIADYRKFHDLWVPHNKLDGIFTNTEE